MPDLHIINLLLETTNNLQRQIEDLKYRVESLKSPAKDMNKQIEDHYKEVGCPPSKHLTSKDNSFQANELRRQRGGKTIVEEIQESMDEARKFREHDTDSMKDYDTKHRELIQKQFDINKQLQETSPFGRTVASGSYNPILEEKKVSRYTTCPHCHGKLTD